MTVVRLNVRDVADLRLVRIGRTNISSASEPFRLRERGSASDIGTGEDEAAKNSHALVVSASTT